MQNCKKLDFENVFPPFHGFSTKSFPDFRGFQFPRFSPSPKNREYGGPPVYFNKT